MFETLDRSQQGDLGEARAIYELVRLGYYVSTPLHTQVPYDLIADKNGQLFKVQVKTSGFVLREVSQSYQVNLQTTGGNRITNTRKLFDAAAVDLLFVMVSDGRCWLIPTSVIKSTGQLVVGTKLYSGYQL